MRARTAFLASIAAAISIAAAPTLAQQCIQVPVGCTVTSAFGSRFNPVTKNFSSEFHHGIDFGCAVGTSVVAAAAGQVSFSGFSSSAGNMVILVAPGGLTYEYMHGVRLVASPGAMISAGQQVLWSGNTGRSTGPHLHFQIQQADKVALEPYSRFCTKPPLKSGVLQGADAPIGDTLDPGSQASAPGGGVAPAMGLDGSLDSVMADVIASRALNPDYVGQLATLSEPRLYAELAYMQTIRLKAQHERSLHRERMLATQAMIQVLMTEAALRPQLEAQRSAANKK